MIYITSEKGENYSFDPSTSRIFKDCFLKSTPHLKYSLQNTYYFIQSIKEKNNALHNRKQEDQGYSIRYGC